MKMSTWAGKAAVAAAAFLLVVMVWAVGTQNVPTNMNFKGWTRTTGMIYADGGIACDTDKFTVANTSGNVATAGTVSMTLVNAASGSANPFDYSGTLGIFNGSDDFTFMDINITNANHTSTGNTVQALDIAAITGDAEATETAIKIGSGWDYGLYTQSPITSLLAAGVQGIALDAATTANTTTDGILKVAFSSVTDAGKGAYIDLGVGDTGASKTINGLYIDTDDDTSSNAATINGIAVVGSDIAGHATTVNRAFYTSGEDVAFQADNGYVRIGTGSTPDVTPGDDDLYVEGTVEVDGAARFDGAVTANSSLTLAASQVLAFTSTTALLLGGGTDGAPLTTATDDKNFGQFYTQSTATGGTSRGLYLKHNLNDTTPSGETLRAYTMVNTADANDAHGAHLSIGFGASGTCAGESAAARHTFMVPSKTLGGTNAATYSELWAEGALSDMSNGQFQRYVLGGDGTGIGLLDHSSALFSLEGGTIDTTHVMQVKSAAAVSHTLRIRVNGTTYYLMVSDAQ